MSGLDLGRLKRSLARAEPVLVQGRIVRATGLMLEASLPHVALGTACEIRGEDGVTVQAEVVGFNGATALLVPFGDMDGIGVLGAAFGLIHVMENLDDPSKLGPGIAVAFVATVYGVGFANMVCLPIANKLKRRLTLEKERKVLISGAVLSIQEGLNPRILEETLKSYAGKHGAHAKPTDKK